MQKESLEKIRDKLIKCISKIDTKEISIIDTTEIMLVVYHLLEPEKYEENIKILSKNNELTKH